MDQDQPFIATKNGNVPERSLTYAHRWVRFGDFIRFEEDWRDATGDLVKNNVHVARIDLFGFPLADPQPGPNDVSVPLVGIGMVGEQLKMT